MNGGRDSGRLLAAILIAAIPVLVDPGAVARVSALWPLAQAGGAYFLPAHGFLLYFWSPVVVLSAITLLLAPGLVLGYASDSREAGQWILAALAWSTVIIGSTCSIATGLFSWSPTGRGFVWFVLALTGLCFASARRRFGNRSPGTNPWEGSANRNALLSMLVVPTMLLIALVPKFYWEAFNGDGAHAYESGRLLLHGPVPFWPGAAGEISMYPGFKTFLSSYPVSWFIRLFGEVEVSARLPYLLFLIAVYGGLITLADFNRKPGAASDRWLGWLGLLVFSVVMAYSATYNPYHADIALPATEDSLCLAWFLGFALAACNGRPREAAGFAALTYFTSPGGLVLIGLWCGASVLLLRPVPWKVLAAGAGTVVGCMVLERLAPILFVAIGLPIPGVEHATGALVERLRNLQWRDWHRIAFLVLPSGILPALALLAWWRQDSTARVIALVALAQFAFFYLQARTALHYFTPAMILPIAVLLRDPALASVPGRRFVIPSALVTALVALYISWPPDASPRLRSREIGSAVEDRLGGYDAMQGTAFARMMLLRGLFPEPAAPGVPDSLYGGAPLEFYYYANRGRGDVAPAYLLIGVNDPAPTGATLVAKNEEAALYLLDRARWELQRAPVPGWTGIAPVYRIPKRMLFHG